MPVFLAVGNLAPIFSRMAFLQNDQKLSINETSLQEHKNCLLPLPFTVFKRKSTAMFLGYGATNSRHVEKFCGVILSVHVLTVNTADIRKTLSDPASLRCQDGGTLRMFVFFPSSGLYSRRKIPFQTNRNQLLFC